MLNADIYIAAGLTPGEILEMPRYINSIDGDMEFYGSPAFSKLYVHFAFTSCEMPPDIAKARTGEPDIWILEYLEENEWETV